MSLRHSGMPSSFFKCLILFPLYTELVAPLLLWRTDVVVDVYMGSSRSLSPLCILLSRGVATLSSSSSWSALRLGGIGLGAGVMSTGGGGGSGGCDGGAAAAAAAMGTAGAGAGDLAGSAGCMMLDRSMPGGGFRCDTGTVSPQRQIRSLPPWISPSHAMRCSVCSSIISGRWLVGGRQVRYARSGRHSKQAASKKRSRDGGSEGTAAHRPKVRGTSISDVDVEVARAPCDELEQSLERRDSDRSSIQKRHHIHSCTSTIFFTRRSLHRGPFFLPGVRRSIVCPSQRWTRWTQSRNV